MKGHPVDIIVDGRIILKCILNIEVLRYET
jgi:hypothetical protein